MAEQVLRSPGFVDREIDQSAPVEAGPSGVPAGVVGTSLKGPAFVPVTVANFDEFKRYFGGLDSKMFGPYAVNEFLKHRQSLTFLRVLGAGANTTSAHINTTNVTGRVTSAGFKLEGTDAVHDTTGRHDGAVQFITALHSIRSAEAYGIPMFTDNASFNGSTASLVRATVMMASGTRLMVLNGDESAVGAFTATGPDDSATIASNVFKIAISSSRGSSFANDDGIPGVKIYSASLNPSRADYIGKLLNTDPDKFVDHGHYLYAHFPVDDEVATPSTVAVVSGTTMTSSNSGETSTTMRQAFGAYDTRYTVPTTPWFISQPFGKTEYDLFRFEALDDGAYANTLYKVTITNLKASIDPAQPYGTFSVQIRSWDDTDTKLEVLEQFNNCSLDPTADNYVAKVIGDRKVFFNFDVLDEAERVVVATGKYQNNSRYVRIIMASDVDNKLVPKKSLPFGFRGAELLKTNDLLTDTTQAAALSRVGGIMGSGPASALSGSILPPVPFRYKITTGEILSTTAFPGDPSPTEQVNANLTWGVKFEKNTTPANSNVSSEKNELLDNYTKFMGIKKLDTLVTGSGADTFNNNKFTLARVALSNTSISHLTASVEQHIKETAYIRNGNPDATTYTVDDGTLSGRVTFATILAQDTAANFNRFSPYAKFTSFFYGGFDGVNILDRDAARLNDKSTSMDTGGGAESSYVPAGFYAAQNGTGTSNNGVVSYKIAVDIMTDPLAVNTNILAIPGIREPYITDYALRKSKDYKFGFYVMDVPSYSDDSTRLFDNSTDRPSVEETCSSLETRAIDNNYSAVYWPDVFIDDSDNKRRVKVPASIAALGALAYNDRIAYPWFAPAGFNRASLDFVKNVTVRLNQTDKNRLSDARMNPIATFPQLGFVIFGQKTLQIKESSLNRVNVRRMLLDVKRKISDIALRKLVFEQNTPQYRADFVGTATLDLAFVKANAGVEDFRIIMDERNNTAEDANLNRVNGRIIIIPTRSIEIIQLDYIISRSGVEFV